MTQTQMVLNALRAGRAITPLEALHEFGCFRLAARIKDLREEGHVIVTETVEANGKSFARYRYVPRQPVQTALFESTV
jgi:hypothetical protein